MHGGKLKQSNGQILQAVAAYNSDLLSRFGLLDGLRYLFCTEFTSYPFHLSCI